jgi:hypothetical protein
MWKQVQTRETKLNKSGYRSSIKATQNQTSFSLQTVMHIGDDGKEMKG